ncbi:S-layer homology domain-containing protein [Agathobaculum butyriciproducens]|uniref:S-layer homology domain-containing protein n=1 Tax=Agathobaculum butyriciproducens TaxID=1628085 RepID=UPI003AB319F0
MKKRNNRFLAGTLAGLMMLTMLPVTALAAQEGADGDAVSDTSNNIVNVVSDGKNVQQAENNNVNVEGNGGTENVQKSADDSNGDSENGQESADASSGDTENVQESADDSNGGSDDTAAANQQEVENSGLSGGNTADTTPAEEPFVAKIGTQTYKTLDEAIEAVQGDEVIEVGEDCTLTVGTIEKAVVINGNGHTISVPEQNTENHALNINASLTFNKANVVFTNENAEWTVTMSGNGVLTLDEGSTCIIEKHGIYADNYATINVKGGSKLTVQNTSYTALMADKEFANLNIEGDSEVIVDRAENKNGVPNGINNFKIKVVGSRLTVTNCVKQGLVRCWLTLDDSNAEISGNGIGICGYNGTDVLIMKNGSNLTMEDNGTAGIFLWGGKVKVEADNTLTITGTGKDIKEKTDSRYDGALAVYYYYNTYTADVNFEDGATVNLIDNDVSAINNDGKVYIGNGTTIMNNGSKTVYGGGIQNRGDITIAPNVKLYNNHAKVAGDDIYNTTGTSANGLTSYTGSITFAPVGDGWILDNCNDPIVGWYHDGKEKRWNGDGKDTEYYADEYEVKAEAVSDALALKAAHGQLCSVTYEVTGDIPSDAGAVPAAAKVKKGGSYTVAPVQTTSQSRYTFSGWRINGVGDVVTEIKDIQQDVKLIGVWTRRSSGGGGGSRKPTVDIPDDVPTGLNGDDHFAYIVGYPNGNVEPNGNITRAEVATIFFRLLTEEVRTANSTQSNSLSDVTRGQWFNHAVSTLSSMGIVKGHNDGTFAPNAPITRAEFAAIAARFDDKNTDTSSKFTDIASHWAKNEIGIAANKGWINGYPDGTFRPNQYITRAEAMTLVNRVLNRLPENSSDLLDSMIKWPDNSDASAWYYLAVQEATNSHAYSDKSKDDKYEKWTTIRDARDWTELEK